MAEPVNVRVRPTERTALPGDEPVVVEMGGPSWDDRAARVLIGERRAADGIEVVEVVADGWRFELEVEPADRAALRERASRGRAEAGAAGPTDIRAIIPGRVVSIAVTAGDEVATGQPLLVLEAMKMQNELRAPRDGRVGRVAVSPGTTVELGDTLLVLE